MKNIFQTQLQSDTTPPRFCEDLGMKYSYENLSYHNHMLCFM